MIAKRVDTNHAEIREGLRKAGYQVVDTHEIGCGFPDLLAVSKRKIIVLLEVKSGKNRLNGLEQQFHAGFLGPCRVAWSLEDAIKIMQEYDEEMNDVRVSG